MGFPGGPSGKEPCQCRRHKRHGFNPWVGKIPWRKAWQPTPVFLPGESLEHRSLVGQSPQGLTESDMTEQLSRHTPWRVQGGPCQFLKIIPHSLCFPPFSSLWYPLKMRIFVKQVGISKRLLTLDTTVQGLRLPQHPPYSLPPTSTALSRHNPPTHSTPAWKEVPWQTTTTSPPIQTIFACLAHCDR